MLEIIQSLMKEHQGELIGKLTGDAGFSAEEAQSFVPPALGQIGEVLGSGGLDLGALLGSGGGGISDLLSKLDLGALAGQSGVDESKAKSGLESLVPLVLSLLQKESGGVEGLLAKFGGGGGGAAGALGSLAGKLFNR